MPIKCNIYLDNANERRSAAAAISQCAHARHAISVLQHTTPEPPKYGRSPIARSKMHDRYLHILQLRVLHSAETLGEIAEMHGMTKHAYWGQLRRALAYSDWIERTWLARM